MTGPGESLQVNGVVWRIRVFEIFLVEVCEFSADLEAVFVFWISHEVHGHMFDDGHILRSVAASQPRKIVVEDDVQDPVEPVPQ